MGDLMNQLFIELVKLLVTGILGGVVGSLMSLKLYKSQKRIDASFETRAKKQEALFNIILILPWIHRDISTNWESPVDEKQTPQEHMVEVVNRINYWKALFIDDTQMTVTLKKLSSLIGVGKDSFFGEGKVFKQYPSQILSEIEETVNKTIIELNK